MHYIKDYLKINIYVLSLALILMLGACNPGGNKSKKAELFKPIKAEFDDHGKLILPKGFKYEVLFSEGDEVLTSVGKKVPAKGMHDCTIFIPIEGSSDHGYLYVSHEDIVKNDELGHGGGATIFEVKNENGKWIAVGDKKNVDFRSVGGTIRNCGGKMTPKGTILTAEEGYANSNIDLWTIYPDTSDFMGKPRYYNFGFMVEVDPITQKAIRKLTAMGRYSHEDAYCLEDRKTVILTEDESPAVLFKFIADKEDDYSEGTLYAYKQSKDTKSGEWIELPRDSNTYFNSRNVAISKGATLFNRHEWLTKVREKMYITETGHDLMDWNWAVDLGGVPAHYFENNYRTDSVNVFSDPYGRVLELDLQTNQIREYVKGGASEKKKETNFSSPDCITSTTLNGINYIVVNEDIIGLDRGRVEGKAIENGYSINEVYFVNTDIETPTVDDLKRFIVGPKGCETTGGFFTPDGKTYFLSIQHPSQENPAPFNKSCVIAITGF